MGEVMPPVDVLTGASKRLAMCAGQRRRVHPRARARAAPAVGLAPLPRAPQGACGPPPRRDGANQSASSRPALPRRAALAVPSAGQVAAS
eukprot:scaffold2578_cov370-Prasinococcus_capsulatus_cf.AAC.6